MRNIAIPFMLAAGLSVATPVLAQNDLGDVISGVAQSLIQQELDKKAYLDAKSANTVSAYRNYLKQFPKGIYRTNAQNALVRLGATVEPVDPVPPTGTTASAASIEASIGLTRSQRILIQKQLTSLGYATGGADGLWGRNTRDAIIRWQTKNKVTATGYLTGAQVRLIGQQAGTIVEPAPTDNTATDDQIEERLLGLTLSERREVQRRLTSIGYNTRGTDGAFGPNTRRALASWQRDEGLRASGYITADQLRELRRQTGG